MAHPRAARAAEERIEDVAEAGEPGSEAGIRSAAHAGPAEHVVRLSALGIGEDLVRLVDLLEARVCLGILADVRMVLLGELPEGALDLGVARTTRDAKHLVEIPLGHHTGSLARRLANPRCLAG